MKLILLVCIIWQWRTSVAVVCHKNEYLRPYNCSLQADYYWRDYDGMLPNDAIPGGSDDGQTTYVAQVLHNHSLLPANLYPCKKEVLSSADSKAFRTKNFIKVLCSQDKERIRWVPTSIAEMHLLTDFTLVVGGTEIGYTLNLGRVSIEGRVIIGKVFPPQALNHGFGVAKRDGTTWTSQSFEILAFEKRAGDSHCEQNCGCAR